MKLNWTRRDFSQESAIRDTLLETLLQKKAGPNEIPEQYDEWIAAAGEPTAVQIDKKTDYIKEEKNPF